MATITVTDLHTQVATMFRDARDEGYLWGGEGYVQECAESLTTWAVEERFWDTFNESADTIVIPSTVTDLFCDYQSHLADSYYG